MDECGEVGPKGRMEGCDAAWDVDGLGGELVRDMCDVCNGYGDDNVLQYGDGGQSISMAKSWIYKTVLPWSKVFERIPVLE